MYRQILTPTEEDHSIKLPKSLFGKKIEVIIKEVQKPLRDKEKRLPKNLKDKSFWEDVPYDPDFLSIKEIRKIAWPREKADIKLKLIS